MPPAASPSLNAPENPPRVSNSRPPGQPLVAACPSCTLWLKHTYHLLKNVEAARECYRQL